MNSGASAPSVLTGMAAGRGAPGENAAPRAPGIAEGGWPPARAGKVLPPRHIRGPHEMGYSGPGIR